MVNEVALALLFGLFGFKIALLYMATGLLVAIVTGVIIGRLGLERWVEDFVFSIKLGEMESAVLSWPQRMAGAWQYTGSILRKVWFYVLVGIAFGAWIHGYVPDDFLLRWAGPDNPLAVPFAVLLGVPLYSNAAGVIPIVAVMLEKGMAMGTALAFMMAVTALSLPEMIILRNVLKVPLIVVYAGIMTIAISLTGYLFNLVLR